MGSGINDTPGKRVTLLMAICSSELYIRLLRTFMKVVYGCVSAFPGFTDNQNVFLWKIIYL